ncbi:hypothetical protein F4821DRAFT_256481 [Hypoxylon rubiginosum]|uniref:Uncharacterized protein n=1 Tax=Hypoxylon rubiginosum TaxID=110542 RepID=A0ACC0DB75_9PEZI|nr:hypothetical protein F4821DRAFT_256481 [Hypoxylon rubiginosum]
MALNMTNLTSGRPSFSWEGQLGLNFTYIQARAELVPRSMLEYALPCALIAIGFMFYRIQMFPDRFFWRDTTVFEKLIFLSRGVLDAIVVRISHILITSSEGCDYLYQGLGIAIILGYFSLALVQPALRNWVDPPARTRERVSFY